jgi:hypothetical protein
VLIDGANIRYVSFETKRKMLNFSTKLLKWLKPL